MTLELARLYSCSQNEFAFPLTVLYCGRFGILVVMPEKKNGALSKFRTLQKEEKNTQRIILMYPFWCSYFMPIYNPKCPSQFRRWLCPSCSLKSVVMHYFIYDFDILPNVYSFQGENM